LDRPRGAFRFALVVENMWRRFLSTRQQRNSSLSEQGNQEEDKAEGKQLNQKCFGQEYSTETCPGPQETKRQLGSKMVRPRMQYSASVPDLRKFQDISTVKIFQDESDGSASEQDRFSDIFDRISDTEETSEPVKQELVRQLVNHEQDDFHESDLFFWEDAEELAVELSDCALRERKVAIESSGTQPPPQEGTSSELFSIDKRNSDVPQFIPQTSPHQISTAGKIPFVGAANIDAEYIRAVLRRFQELGWRDDVSLTKTVISTVDAKRIIKETTSMVAAEPNILDVSVPEGGVVHIIGDIHGHLYDLSSILEHTGYPSSKNALVFNGDYVDRGSWGVEVLLILCLLKLWEPHRVHLLRGNHETSYCNVIYGFRKECIQKYNLKVYLLCQQLFCHLPVAAVVSNRTVYAADRVSPEPGSLVERQRSSSLWKSWRNNSIKLNPRNRNKFSLLKSPLGTSFDLGLNSDKNTTAKGGQHELISGSMPDTSPNTSGAGSDESPVHKVASSYLTPLEENEKRVLVLHGGLFRNSAGKLGSLKELGQIQRNLPDPTGTIEDLLWSDPDYIYGFGPNRIRGAGIAFGPDTTKQFLRDNHLSYIIRSHEGPDAREKRKDFPSLTQGHSVDFVTIGRRKKEIFSESTQKDASSSDCDSIETLPLLITVFSAPAYPEGPNARNNLGAICTLDESMEPSFRIFHANQRPCKTQTTAMLVEDAMRDLKTAALERSSVGRIFLKLSGRN